MAKQRMPGLDLAEAFYTRVIAPLVPFPHSACLLGEGSEVLGFDSPRSQDHEWGPRVQILVAPEHVATVRARIEEGLPATFEGFDTTWFSLASGTVTHHVQVAVLDEWITETLGFDPRSGMDAAAWLGLPQQRLLHLTAGRVFHDDDGELTRIRKLLHWYPDDVWMWMMLSAWHLVSTTEPMRGRCIETGDALGARLLTARLCRLAMELAFLQERRYWPYDKWFGTAFGRLDAATDLTPLLDRALTPGEPSATAIRDVLTWLGRRHDTLGLGASVVPRYGPFEVGINDAVRPYETINAGDYVRALRETTTDEDLRALLPVGSIDQLTHGDDVLVTYTDWPARLTREYRDTIGHDRGE